MRTNWRQNEPAEPNRLMQSDCNGNLTYPFGNLQADNLVPWAPEKEILTPFMNIRGQILIYHNVPISLHQPQIITFLGPT